MPVAYLYTVANLRAVLGLNGQSGARRLTRALLADPLASKPPEWERLLAEMDETDERALLLRYGEQHALDDRHPLVRTLSIPSSILHTHNLEVLVHSTAPMAEPTNDGATNFLVPSLDLANSSSGRLATVTYPVHKALVYEEGLNDLGTLAALDLHARKAQNRMFKGVIDWSWSTSQQGNKSDQPVLPINLALAEAAIDVFRQSLDKSMEYEHLWFDAGMPNVAAWLSEGTDAQPGALKPAIRSLVETICNRASAAIHVESASRSQQEKAMTIPNTTKTIVNQGISIWAENAHTELRDRLGAAFNSISWKKLKWWKLFWRVDDVGYIASDILQRAWLVEAEKEMIWITGRIYQSGLLGPLKLRPTPVPDPEDEEQKLGSHPPQLTVEDIVPQTSTDFSEPPPVQHPWPQNISNARTTISKLTIAPLQSLSQALLLQTISTNVLTSSLSALLYTSVSTTSLYEAGAIAALGLVYSLRRLQKKWETARSEWQLQLREAGRRILRNEEEMVREAVREGGKPKVDEVGIEQRRLAMEAVAEVNAALEDMKA